MPNMKVLSKERERVYNILYLKVKSDAYPWALVSQTNISLPYKNIPGTNTIAYFDTTSLRQNKSYAVLAPGKGEGQTKEPLLKGKDQYGWPPCTKLFRSVEF